jgi:hypothetical protein
MRGTHRGGCARVRGTTLGLGGPGCEAVTLGVGPYHGLRMNVGLGVPTGQGVVRGRGVGPGRVHGRGGEGRQHGEGWRDARREDGASVCRPGDGPAGRLPARACAS